MATRKRANPQQKQPPEITPKVVLTATGVILGLVLVGVAIASLIGDPESSFTCTSVNGFADVHGLAVAPDDVSLVYVATHHGLMRGTDDTGWCRLGASQDDFMGFAMHPENGSIFWVSGHPELGGNMGVRQSTDGGYTWETLALKGVDFHAMTVSPADPERLWGTFRGEVYRSDDGGHDWSTVGGAPQGTMTLAGHPTDPEVAYAATAGGLFRSGDGGATWFRISDVPLTAFAVHPSDPETFMAATRDGQIVRSEDGGEQWEAVGFQAASLGHVTYARGDPDILYAATYRGDVYKSVDGGTSWDQVL